MKYIKINLSDFEYDILMDEIQTAKQFFEETFNENNYSFDILMNEDQAISLKETIDDYLLDENTIRGRYEYDIVKDIKDNIYEELSWLPYMYDDFDYEEYED